MHKIEITETGKVLEYPENGKEFTRDQFLGFVDLLVMYQGGVISFNELKVRLVYLLLNMKRVIDVSKSKNTLVLENINLIAKLNDGFFSLSGNSSNKIVINMDFIINLLPSVYVGRNVYYGPSDALFNTVYGEYIQLTTHLNDFSNSRDESSLDSMIATIYRPKKRNYNKIKGLSSFDGDIRMVFNPSLTDYYKKDLKKLPYNTKYAIFLFVASCNHFIANNTALDIGGGNTINLSSLFSKSSVNSNNSNSLGMIDTLYSVAQTKVFGDVKDVAKQNTYDIFAFMISQKNEYEKNKSKSK